MSVLAEVKKVSNHRDKIQTRVQKENQARLKDETEKKERKEKKSKRDGTMSILRKEPTFRDGTTGFPTK